VPIIFKASFDKANRSRAGAARGPGLEEGLRRLERVRAETGLPLLTDIHDASQPGPVAEVCDVLQIPAFLSRQTDLVEAAARTGRPLNIKKGQWMAPEDMAGAVEKARAAGSGAIAVTERGTLFGYGDLVVDMRSFERMRSATGACVVFDGTHSVQRPGRADGASGGDPQYIQPLVLAAMAAGADALFMEVHPSPERAPSDGSNMLPLARLPALLDRVLDVRAAGRGDRAGRAASV
jgi:2-dehydro-3-deoxyphosphooctonate aldolase (KDO 8-P synthase)